MAWSDDFQALWNAETLEHARHLRDCYGVGARFIADDVTTLPLADDAFDVAFSGWVVQMIEDLDACLLAARRVLQEQGVLGVDVPHPFYECFDPATESIERSYHAPQRRAITIDEAYDSNR
jgi:ubiquinone/menaquinone biosynthesis C-methylase UbiE